jgi:hypothetical protein
MLLPCACRKSLADVIHCNLSTTVCAAGMAIDISGGAGGKQQEEDPEEQQYQQVGGVSSGTVPKGDTQGPASFPGMQAYRGQPPGAWHYNFPQFYAAHVRACFFLVPQCPLPCSCNAIISSFAVGTQIWVRPSRSCCWFQKAFVRHQPTIRRVIYFADHTTATLNSQAAAFIATV